MKMGCQGLGAKDGSLETVSSTDSLETVFSLDLVLVLKVIVWV